MLARFLLRAVPLLALARAVRVRREIRSLPEAERAAVFAALTVMKNTSQADGEARFGPDFVNYEAFVVKHAHCATHPRCDQGHYGPAFATYHRAFNLLMERSLLSVDPGIEALPYWDYNLDLERYADPRDSEVWTASYFGENEGDPADGYMIRDGPFAAWRVHADARALSPGLGNAFNMLRGPTNLQAAPRLTRASSICGRPTPTTFSLANWTTCLQTPATFDAFFDCIDAGARARARRPLARGVFRACFIARSRIKPSLCAPPAPAPAQAWAACTRSRTVGSAARGARPTATAPRSRTARASPTRSRAAWSARPTATRRTRRAPRRARARATTPRARARDTGVCQRYPGGDGHAWDPAGPCAQCGDACADGELGANGDFWDGCTSPNDPVFWFHHPNVDRLFMEWQLLHANATATPLPHSGFPTAGHCPGHTLGDVIADTDPFVGALLGRDGLAASLPLTNADVLAATTPLGTAPYTYDTLVGAREPTLPFKRRARA